MEKQTILQTGVSLQNGKYRIERVLGQGGFGITYLAYQTTFQDNVVIKEFFLNGFCMRAEDNAVHSINLPTGEFGKFKDRFLQEARFLYKLKGNKNIAEVVDFFEENGTAYMVMPFIAEEDVEKYTRKQPNNRLSETEAIDFMKQTANALEIVHANHILHRDIKPSNLLRKNDGTVVLIDFGSARELLSGEFSQAMSTIISAGYAPPEQYNVSAKRGPFSDIYSMGGTLYRLITGKMPLDATMRSIEDLPEPMSLNSSISEHVNHAIMKAMQLKPANRYQNVAEFIADLAQPFPIYNDDEEKTIILPDENKTEILVNTPISVSKEPKTAISQATPKPQTAYTPPTNIPVQPGAWHQKTPIRVGIVAALLGLIGFGAYKVANTEKTEKVPVIAQDTNTTEKSNTGDIPENKPTNTETGAEIAAKEQRIQDSIKRAAQQMSEAEKLKSFNEAKQKGDILFQQKQYAAAKQAYTNALQINPKDNYCKNQIQSCEIAIAQSQNPAPTNPQNPNNPPPRPMRTTGTIAGLRDATGEVFDYEGDIVQGVPNGQGTFKYKNGSTCKGNVNNGHLNGQCECNYEDGAKFVGSAVNDVCTGFGKYYFPDGGRYEGNFANDNFNGAGKMYVKNGKEWFEGNFQNGNVVGAVVWHYADGSTQKGRIEGTTFVPEESDKTQHNSKPQKTGDIKTHHKL